MTQERSTTSDPGRGWLDPSIPTGETERIRAQLTGLEASHIDPLWPLLLGIAAGIAVPAGLLIVSL